MIMEAMIIFACVLIILVCLIWIGKQMFLGITWIVQHTVEDVYKDLDLGTEKKE